MAAPRRESDPKRQPKIMMGVVPPRSRLNFERRRAFVNEGSGFENKSYDVLVPGPHPDDRNK